MTTAAAIQPNYSINIPQKEQVGEFFVFFVADQIPGYVKANNPDWNPGGILRPGVLTLRHRLGYVRKCEITALREQMLSEAATNIHPGERRHMVPTYEINDENGRHVIGKNADGSHDGLLRVKWYPADEIDRITGQGDGLVRMPCSSAEEAIDAQYFLFPEWDAIKSGVTELPRRISDLLAHFRTRLQAAATLQQEAVVRAAIKSCEDYRTWGNSTTTDANATLRQMQTKGVAWTYGLDAELAFEQLGLQRQDSLVQDQGNKLDGLVDAMTTFVKQTSPATPAVDPEYQEFLRWKAAQHTQAAEQTAVIPTVESVSGTAPEGDIGIPISESEAESTESVRWVLAEGRKGYVTKAKHFGKVRVKFEDGFEALFTPDQIVETEA